MITLSAKLFWQSFKQANKSDEVEVIEDISPSLKKWLAENIQIKELLDLILEFPFAESVQLCANYFYSPADIRQMTEEYRTINESYVVVGTSACGDWIAIPRKHWDSIGYISHEDFGYDENDLPNYCGVTDCIGELYFNTWNMENYPCDYYEALKYNRKMV